ncbi:MAG: tetratricopeptide repeat protein [Phycisphaerales bacterium]|nr:tetratricopeptide repeat protein [Phycisphaerales bacterium]
MALKPRTFRRIILLGSLASVVLLVLVGYFVIRPWQANRSIESMRSQGLAAVESGDLPEASKQLGRYLSRTDNPEPEIELAFARARAKVQTSDGGYIKVAIRSYRSYLTSNPGDIEASKELLPLFNLVGMSLEAKTLGETIRKQYSDNSIEVLRELRHAVEILDDNNPELEELYAQSIENESASFVDFFEYVHWLKSDDRVEESDQYIATMLATKPSIDIQLVDYWNRFTSDNELANAERGSPVIARYVDELAGLIGLNLASQSFNSDPTYLSHESTGLINRLFNVLGRYDLSLQVRLATANKNNDYDSIVWSARRLYWESDFETLASLADIDSEGDPVADVYGYQILAAKDQGQTEIANELLGKLAEVDLDFRARAWQRLIEGRDLLNENKSAEARPIIKKAIEMYPTEPTFNLVLGDIYARHGRIAEAKDQWVRSLEYVNESSGNVGWIDPVVRIIDTYSAVNRLAEVIDYVDLLGRIAPRNPIASAIQLQSISQLARSSQLSRTKILEVLAPFESASEISPEALATIAPQIATMYASVGKTENAKNILLRAMESNPNDQLAILMLGVDSRYQLGVADELGIDLQRLTSSSPRSALQFALNKWNVSGDAEEGLAFIDRGIADAGENDPNTWALIRTQYLDAVNSPEAEQAWRALLAQNPEDVDLLYRAIDSNAIGKDIVAVDELIAKVVELNSTAGQAVPSRLRLARAVALTKERITKDSRLQALEIIRGVVANEQDNIYARNMLGRLLAVKPAPDLEESERFEPDMQGAVDQYLVISRQVNGRVAQNYLLEAADLSYENNDNESSRQHLLEFVSRFPNDYQILGQVAKRFKNMNELDSAADIYARVYRNETESLDIVLDSGIELANIYHAQQNRSQGVALLNDLRESETLSEEQVFEIASLFAKFGYQGDGVDIASSGKRYGLDSVDSKLVHAKFARAYISSSEFERLLRELIETEPETEQAWSLLIRSFIRDQRYDDAKELVTLAQAQLPESTEIKSLALMSNGQLTSATQLIESGAVESNPIVEAAVKRVDEFTAAKPNRPANELRGLLISMLNEFPEFQPIQRFALVELQQLGMGPVELSAYANRAAKFMPGESTVMRIAGNAYLDSNNPTEAKRIATLWRSNVTGSPIDADILIARAEVLLNNFEKASQTLSPYIQGAVNNPDLSQNIDVLLVFSHAQLKLGEDPAMTASRIESALATSKEIRQRVWLNLVAYSVPDANIAASWLDKVTPYIEDDELVTLGNSWMLMINRFEAFIPEYAQPALDTINRAVELDASSPITISSLARANYVMALSVSDTTLRSNFMSLAYNGMVQADQLEPTNLGYLAQAASYAMEADNSEFAEVQYREILSREPAPGPFTASIYNNLAMLIERKGGTQQELDEAYRYSVQATELWGDTPSFWGTRGWVEIATERLNDAETSFLRAIEVDSSNIEGWAGLAIVQYQLGGNRVEDAANSFQRVMNLLQNEPTQNQDLVDRLRSLGDDQWAMELGE